ncbi:MAG: hypothetical protein QGF39_06425 [Dehalococcoidia bacterium]|jgi:hypothetical protein|nr:hypothetical protein [Dehalococcoidia bacterium]
MNLDVPVLPDCRIRYSSNPTGRRLSFWNCDVAHDKMFNSNTRAMSGGHPRSTTPGFPVLPVVAQGNGPEAADHLSKPDEVVVKSRFLKHGLSQAAPERVSVEELGRTSQQGAG